MHNIKTISESELSALNEYLKTSLKSDPSVITQHISVEVEYEPMYIVDYLHSYPTLAELWGENEAQYRKMPPLSADEHKHLNALFQEYRECIERMYKCQARGLTKEYNQAREAWKEKQREAWTFCAEHGLPNIVVHNGDKKGIQDLDGEKILPAIYDEFCVTHDAIEHIVPINYYVCKKDGKWGVVDKRNKVRIPFEYDKIFRLVNYPYMFYVEKDGKKGLVKLTPFEVYDESVKRQPKQEETMTFVIPCEMDEIYFIEHKNLFVFRQENKYGWYWETSIPNPRSFSACIYDELYIPVPWSPECQSSYDDDFFEARKGKEHEYIVIWTHIC